MNFNVPETSAVFDISSLSEPMEHPWRRLLNFQRTLCYFYAKQMQESYVQIPPVSVRVWELIYSFMKDFKYIIVVFISVWVFEESYHEKKRGE